MSRQQGIVPQIPPLPWAAVAILAMSGAAAVAHELLWTRRMVDVLGASAASTSRVFGCFFLGLAIGAAAAQVSLRRIRRPWLAAACCELAVSALALVIWSFPWWSDSIWLALGPERLVSSLGGGVKLLLSVALIIPPACCMGMALPLVAAGVSSQRNGKPRSDVRLYAWNTAGGALGPLAILGVMLAGLDASKAMLLAAGGNVAVALLCLRMNRNSIAAVPTHGVRAKTPTADAKLLLAIAAFSGFAVLAFEVAAFQLTTLFAPLSFHAPMTILFVAITMMSLAAWHVSRTAQSSMRILASSLLAAGLLSAMTPLIFQLTTQWFDPGPSANIGLYLLKLASFGLLTLGPALYAAGLVFPRVIQAWQYRLDRTGGQPSGLGWLLAVNGIGGFVGAEFAHRLLIPFLGIHAAFGILGFFYVVASGLAKGIDSAASRPQRKAIPVMIAIGILALTAFTLYRLPHHNPHLGFRLLEEFFGHDGPVAVIESDALGRAILVSNQYVLGSTNVSKNQERQAHLPLALHAQPREIAFIGVATGSTPGAALMHPDVNVTAIELSPEVLVAAERYFGEFNHDLVNSNATIIAEDGRTYLATCDGRFDVVAGDLFLPWAPGEGRLFSEEHFLAIRRALRPHGVFCQWLPMYQLTPQQFELILATFQRAFPAVHLFKGSTDDRNPTIALIGIKNGCLDWEVIEKRAAALRQLGIDDPIVTSSGGLRGSYLGTMERPSMSSPINTLNNLALELSTARERVTGSPGAKYLYGSAWRKWLALEPTSD